MVNEYCLTQWRLPTLSLKEVGDALMPVIEEVTDVYSVDEQQFTYAGTDMLFEDQMLDLIEQRTSWSYVEEHTLEQWFVMIPTILLAWEQSQDRTFYASVRDTSTYGTCRKTNYDVAMRELNWLVVSPGEKLNMNKLIAHKPWYCTWWSHFMFYQGACWWSTQLFWNWLINPYMEVTKRYAHWERYAWFYWSNIMWDDASMYERWKQLELQNISEHEVYFGTVVRPSDNNTILLSMVPEKSSLSTMVQKQQTGKRSAVVTNSIFDINGSVIYQKDWTSYYRWINTDTDTD